MKIAIIGSREATPDVVTSVQTLAGLLALAEYTVASGGNGDVDLAATRGVGQRHSLVYLPWEGFNATQMLEFPHAEKIAYDPRRHEDWARSVTELHPCPDKLTKTVLKLHARNYGIVHDARLVVAFPKEKGRVVSTAQGIRIARALRIPVLEYPVYGEPRWTREQMITDVFKSLGEKK